MLLKTPRRIKRFAGIILTISTVILSWIGLGIFVPELTAIENLPHRIYRVVKVATGGDPTVDAEPAKNVPWQLQVVKIFVVLILLFAVFKIIQKVFRDQYTLFKTMFKYNHSIICGIGSKGLQVIKDIEKTGNSRSVGIEINPDSGKALLAQKDGFSVIWGDARDREILMESGIKRAANLISFLPGEQSGLEVLNVVQDIYGMDSGGKLNCYLQITNPRLIDLIQKIGYLKGVRSKGVSVRFFNLERMIARHLFHCIANDYFNDIGMKSDMRSFRLIIFGFGSQGEALLKQALRVMHFGTARKTEIVVADRNIDEKYRKFKEDFPFADKALPLVFEEFGGTYKEIVNKYITRTPDLIPIVFAAFENDEDNLTLALEVLNYTPKDRFRIYSKNSEEKNIGSFLKGTGSTGARLSFFGNMKTFCSMEYITGKEQDALAEIIHNDYLGQQKEMVASESQRYKTTWDSLLEDARDANRAQADHLIFKLAIAGVKPEGKKSDWRPTDDQVETLAIIEHDRWCAHRYLNGWDFGTKRDDAKKLHPSLVPWSELSAGEKQKDIDTIHRIPLLIEQSNLMASAMSI